MESFDPSPKASPGPAPGPSPEPSLEPAPRGGPQEIPRPTSARLGAAPAWSGAIGSVPSLDLDDIAQRLTQMSIDRAMSMVAQSRQRSAVAVVLSQGRRGPELLLTRRAWHMRTHRGEIAFPGGGEEDGDVFPVGTALREACEEVALDPGSVEPIAALDPMVTFTSDKAVVPIVFETDQRPSVVASPDEVDAILQVSFADLLEEGCYRQELWTWSGSTLRDAPEAGYQHPVHFFELYGDTLWGATASMINQLLTVVFAPEAFEELMRGPEHFGR